MKKCCLYFPNEIFIEIFKFVDPIDDSKKLRLVSKRFKELSDSDYLWSIYLGKFKKGEIGCKERYKERLKKAREEAKKAREAKLKQDGWALRYSSEELRGYMDVVMEAVKQYEHPIKYASVGLCEYDYSCFQEMMETTEDHPPTKELDAVVVVVVVERKSKENLIKQNKKFQGKRRYTKIKCKKEKRTMMTEKHTHYKFRFDRFNK